MLMVHRSIVAMSACAGLACVASAQTAWLNPVNGTWGTAGNWTAGVPTAALDATLGHGTGYDVTMNVNGTSKSLTISNALANLLISAGMTYTAAGDISNAGVITLNATGGASDARIVFGAATSTLGGSGTLVLGAVGALADAHLTYSAIPNVMTHASGHTITGKGQIYINTVNNGQIIASGAGNTIQLLDRAKANTNLMVAQSGGMIDVEGVTLTQSGGGTLRATGGGSIVEASGGVVGGVVEGLAGGLYRTGGTLVLDSVACNGTGQIQSGHDVQASNSLTNSGVLTLNPTGGAGDARLLVITPAFALDGEGEIVLGAVGTPADAHITFSAAGNVMTQAATHTISGSGQIYTNIINNGLITADLGGKSLELLLHPKTNNNLMLAENGGLLDIGAITVTQGPSGVIRAVGAGSVVEASGSIVGGVVESVGAGSVIRTGGTLGLDILTLNGAMQVLSGHTVNASNAIINNATITVNPTGGAADARFFVATPTLNLNGTGEIVLNAVGSMADAHVTFSAASNLLVNGPDHALAGRGQIYTKTTNQGKISPGHANTGDLTQNIELAGTAADVTCQASSFIQIEIESGVAGQYDTITGGASIDFVCGGTLALSHLGGFVGMLPGEFIDIIDVGTVTGEFSEIQRPTLDGQNRYEVQYLADRVRLVVVCYADCDADLAFTIDDFICFQTLFALGDSYADCDLDSFLSIDDFICYQTYFAIGC